MSPASLSADPATEVLPIYFLADESWSMADDPRSPEELSPVSTLNHTLVELRDAVALSPVLGDKARLSVITFAGSALCRLPLSPLRDDLDLPTLATRDGGTSYGAAFDELFHRLQFDLAELKDAGMQARPPLVFFLSDGQPTDPPDHWRAARDRVVETFAPTILAFGVGDLNADTVQAIATGPGQAFLASHPDSAARAVALFGRSLVESIVISTAYVAEARPGAVIVAPDEFTALDWPGDDDA